MPKLKWHLLDALTVTLLPLGSLQAQQAGTKARQIQETEQDASALPAGQAGTAAIAVRDPRTGRLRAATGAERRELLRNLAGRSSVARIASVGPNGTRRAVVAPGHLKALAVKRAKDGSLVYGHIGSEAEWEAFAEAPVDAAASEEARDDR